MKRSVFIFLVMQHIQGISRNQSHLSSLEDKITSDNYARFIDAFIKFMDLDKRTIQKKEAFMPLEIFIT
ncbi:MAG: hypothetical protein QM535_20605 [Limnohabitans sp.]|nr:hypothetical protein [Limnohabitans sp.]